MMPPENAPWPIGGIDENDVPFGGWPNQETLDFVKRLMSDADFNAAFNRTIAGAGRRGRKIGVKRVQELAESKGVPTDGVDIDMVMDELGKRY